MPSAILMDNLKRKVRFSYPTKILGEETFGPLSSRWLNQNFYRSKEWEYIKREVVLRDNACDMALQNYPIPNGAKIIIHHMNPLMPNDITDSSEYLLDPEYLICVSHNTHQAIHYGDESLLISEPIVRTKNDTCPWRN